MRYNKTFKKYRAECRPEVLVSVKEYAAANDGCELYEDESILKVTASREVIDTMIASLTEQHGGLYNETDDPAPEDDSAD